MSLELLQREECPCFVLELSILNFLVVFAPARLPLSFSFFLSFLVFVSFFSVYLWFLGLWTMVDFPALKMLKTHSAENFQPLLQGKWLFLSRHSQFATVSVLLETSLLPFQMSKWPVSHISSPGWRALWKMPLTFYHSRYWHKSFQYPEKEMHSGDQKQ